MDVKSLDDVLKLKDEFSRRLDTRIKALERGGKATMDELIDEKRALLKQSKARMEAAERAKSSMVKRLDAELGRHKETVDRLERELEELTKGPRVDNQPRRAKRKKQ